MNEIFINKLRCERIARNKRMKRERLNRLCSRLCADRLACQALINLNSSYKLEILFIDLTENMRNRFSVSDIAGDLDNIGVKKPVNRSVIRNT